ncbi:hypothetical protein TNCV_4689561 [Trichonephila clavipes]|nr:hypothetical protein TNCV_4689561 [Trichonephila clavipes]
MISELDLPNVRIQRRNPFHYSNLGIRHGSIISTLSAAYTVKSTVAPVNLCSASVVSLPRQVEYDGRSFEAIYLMVQKPWYTRSAKKLPRSAAIQWCVQYSTLRVELCSKGFRYRVLADYQSHVGIIGNEQAGRRGKVGDDASAASCSAIGMKRVIMHHIFKIWQESWSQQLDNKLHSVKPVIGAWPDANAKN